ncbi:MAG TPA: hypothetical protein DHW65_07310 [Dehalococcoidia bacterium]|nr:hypothetical protein [SAR202 cluster bacterium]HAA95044.1 hypothetical protein [Dehalococcoidia bacterium]HCL26133.1 hypothetical protein [Dehalococcoidia bacterium]|tara:strand:- start:1481 stop:1846 length:366 start_codon:yes stop_codon:yes gene_type:complete
MGQVDHPFAAEGPESALVSITDQLVPILKSINLETVLGTPFGDIPGGQFITIPITDVIVHTWDIAKSTGQDTTMDAGLAEFGYNVMTQVVPSGRENGAFEPEVVVPATASFQGRLLGLSGR